MNSKNLHEELCDLLKAEDKQCHMQLHHDDVAVQTFKHKTKFQYRRKPSLGIQGVVSQTTNTTTGHQATNRCSKGIAQ